MIEHLSRRRVASAVVMVVLASVSAGCMQLSPPALPGLSARENDDPVYALARSISATETAPAASDAAASATSVPDASKSLARDVAAVRRGPMVDALVLSGRVAGTHEATLKFPNSGRVTSVNVAPGESVQEGQVLVETGADDIQARMEQAQAEVETTSVRLEQARAQAETDAQTRDRDNRRRAQDDAAQRRASAADAEAALHRAEAELAAVQAGPSEIDIRTGESAVASAHMASQKAESELEQLSAGPDEAVVRTAQRDLALAQTEVDHAQADVDRLTRGADATEIRAAEREVQRAQNALKFAESVKLEPTATSRERADLAQSIAQAQLDVQDAQDRLAKVKQAPDSSAVALAQRTLEQDKLSLTAAKAALDKVRAGASQADIDQAQAAVDAAHAAEQNAQARLDALRAHPTAEELRAAQDRVAAAQAGLARVNNTSPPPATEVDDPGAAYNVVLIEKDLARAQARVDSLHKDLEATRLVAPFAGTVTGVMVRTGDQLSPGTPAVSLAGPGDALVRVELLEKDLPRLAPGQAASFRVNGAAAGTSLTGKLIDVVTATTGQGNTGPVARFLVNWPGDADTPAFGTPVEVQVALKNTSATLIVPRKALHSAGQRQYVQVVQGANRRIVNVQVGIQTRDEVEVLDGLSEGQLVVVGP